MAWLSVVVPLLDRIGAVVHVAVGTHRRRRAQQGALAALGPVPCAAALWAVGRGLPDEVVARSVAAGDGPDGRTEAVLSWASGPEVELLVATGVADRAWLVVTGTVGEIEIRPDPWSGAAGQVLLSDGRDTQRIAFAAGEPGRFADEHDVAAVLLAVRQSAADGGRPVHLP